MPQPISFDTSWDIGDIYLWILQLSPTEVKHSFISMWLYSKSFFVDQNGFCPKQSGMSEQILASLKIPCLKFKDSFMDSKSEPPIYFSRKVSLLRLDISAKGLTSLIAENNVLLEHIPKNRAVYIKYIQKCIFFFLTIDIIYRVYIIVKSSVWTSH